MNGERVAGGTAAHVAIRSDAIEVARVADLVEDPQAGCSVVFTGTVRNHAPGKTGVTKLEYEAYAGVVESKITEIVDEALGTWDLTGVAVEHRVGELTVGEPAVVVAVSSAHRKDAFPAASFIIDELKARAPIWKKEHWDGGAEWVEGA